MRFSILCAGFLLFACTETECPPTTIEYIVCPDQDGDTVPACTTIGDIQVRQAEFSAGVEYEPFTEKVDCDSIRLAAIDADLLEEGMGRIEYGQDCDDSTVTVQGDCMYSYAVCEALFIHEAHDEDCCQIASHGDEEECND